VDYYQGVVLDYLRADRAVFVNPECCIQLAGKPNPDTDTAWYCDAVAVDLRNHTVFLCEISYANGLRPLVQRLNGWAQHWDNVCKALERDCKVESGWAVRPWLFVPECGVERLISKLSLIKNSNGALVFQPRITTLESVQPWNYCSWNHQDKDTPRPDSVPPSMRL